MPSRPSSIAEVLLSASVRVMDVGEVEWTSARDDGSRIFVNAMGCGVDALVARVVSQAATVKGRGRYLAAIRKAVKEWQHPVRSEERRVGKEGRWRSTQEHCNEATLHDIQLVT